MMEALKYPLFLSEPEIAEQLQRCAFYYAHAKRHHPILRRFARPRGLVGFRDIFKIAASIADPFRCSYQLVCAWSRGVAGTAAEVLARQPDVRRAAVVSGEAEGYDEWPVQGGTLFLVEDGRCREETLDTGLTALSEAENDLLVSGDPNASECTNPVMKQAEVIRQVLDPEVTGPSIEPKRRLVVANAALGLWIADRAQTIEQAIKCIQKSIDDGTSLKKVDNILGQ